MKYVCDVCGYEYDPAVGDPDNGIEPGTTFEDLPEDWVCPLCSVGKDRFSPRNTMVAQSLVSRGFATLLFDLLTESEASDRGNVFDIPLLADRVGRAVRWAESDARVKNLPIGLFKSVLFKKICKIFGHFRF